MEKIAYVILHYLVKDETIECINSIKNNIKYENNEIVVVDNGSFNNSGKELYDLYKNDEKVKVIISEKNLGFAKGNNLGYKYAKEILKCDFIVVLNNDTVIEQEDFSDRLVSIYERTKYHILGPDIVSTKVENYHQNPANLNELKNIKDVENHIKALKKSYRKCLFKKYTKTDVLVKKLRKGNAKIIKTNNFIDKELENIKLHGSCLIYSKDFIKENENAFNPNTFMYMEEDVLYYEAKKRNYKTLYSPELQIFHKEDISTDNVMKNNIDKDIFILKHSIDSAKVILDIFKN